MTGILVFLCLYGFLFDPLGPYLNRRKLDGLQTDFNVAKAKWEARGIKNYSYVVEKGVSLWGECSARLTVRAGKLVEVIEIIHGGPSKLSTPVSLPYDNWRRDICDYSNLTIPEVFDRVQMILTNNSAILDATFDQEFGFVDQYDGSPNIRQGLLIVSIADSGFYYKFSNFQSLDVSPSTR